MRKIKKIWKKNKADFQAVLSNRLQKMLNYEISDAKGRNLPIFVFHSVEPQQLESQLKYLALNGYKSLNAAALIELIKSGKRNDKKTVALTFDDATGSFWATAFPLLKKYQFKAILFAIQGLVPDDDQIYPNLDDLWKDRCSKADIENREKLQPLCTWKEIIKMHDSGFVDVQSHSMTHSRIFISPIIDDYINPKFDAYFYGNVNIPLNANDSVEKPTRDFVLGRPIYKSSSILSGMPRFLEDLDVSKKLVEYVDSQDKVYFFKKPNWRNKLRKLHRKVVRNGINLRYESSKKTEKAIRYELYESKKILESKLIDKKITAFCYPWFQGSKISDRIAAECGYEVVFYGLDKTWNWSESRNDPIRVSRISEEFLFCLPGIGKRSLLHVYLNKFSRLRNGLR